jgi:activator of 2-hydroxyglutaryl-CoA dehydratase
MKDLHPVFAGIDVGASRTKVVVLDREQQIIGRAVVKSGTDFEAASNQCLTLALDMAVRLDIPLENLDGLARQSESMVELGSFCTVFSATEVLEKIRQGKKVPDIVKGLFFSVIKRVMEMDSLSEHVVMTGGVVAHNAYLVQMTEEMIGRPILVPEYPQLTGALGAALYAMEHHEK